MLFAGICAGGQGTRFKSGVKPEFSNTPKQFLLLEGKPVISYCVETFLRWGKADKIFVAAAEEYIDYCEKLFADKRVKVIKGGKTRGDTVALLVKECEKYGAEKDDILATHDAARPFVTTEGIERSVEAAKEHGASGTALPASDTVLECRGGFVAGAPARSGMYLAQTPQCFKIGVFNEVWERLSEAERESATDVCGMIWRAGGKVRIVEGDKECFKITFEEDFYRAEELLRKGLTVI